MAQKNLLQIRYFTRCFHSNSFLENIGRVLGVKVHIYEKLFQGLFKNYVWLLGVSGRGLWNFVYWVVIAREINLVDGHLIYCMVKLIFSWRVVEMSWQTLAPHLTQQLFHYYYITISVIEIENYLVLPPPPSPSLLLHFLCWRSLNETI